MIERLIKGRLLELAGKHPIVSVTGPRQSGKTTLVRDAFPDYEYLSFENPDVHRSFDEDPKSFLLRYDSQVIFDEAQRVPNLFSYLQGVVDESGAAGRFILTGSQNFLLMDAVSQSLAGRVALLTLLPLSYEELSQAGIAPQSMEQWLFQGGIHGCTMPTLILRPSSQATCRRTLSGTSAGSWASGGLESFRYLYSYARCVRVSGSMSAAWPRTAEWRSIRQRVGSWSWRPVTSSAFSSHTSRIAVRAW